MSSIANDANGGVSSTGSDYSNEGCENGNQALCGCYIVDGSGLVGGERVVNVPEDAGGMGDDDYTKEGNETRGELFFGEGLV